MALPASTDILPSLMHWITQSTMPSKKFHTFGEDLLPDTKDPYANNSTHILATPSNLGNTVPQHAHCNSSMSWEQWVRYPAIYTIIIPPNQTNSAIQNLAMLHAVMSRAVDSRILQYGVEGSTVSQLPTYHLSILLTPGGGEGVGTNCTPHSIVTHLHSSRIG